MRLNLKNSGITGRVAAFSQWMGHDDEKIKVEKADLLLAATALSLVPDLRKTKVGQRLSECLAAPALSRFICV